MSFFENTDEFLNRFGDLTDSVFFDADRFNIKKSVSLVAMRLQRVTFCRNKKSPKSTRPNSVRLNEIAFHSSMPSSCFKG